jgi:UDP-N-acetylglucosamine--N-acetylmuramyl-(pentapeptide) pyrophosphoryl-undecaprenol N-acetylglucosamine transferase
VDRSIYTLLDPLRLAASVPQAAALLAMERPAAILTTGGFVAIPVLLAARPLGIPVVLWEGNVIPGRSVRSTARLASVIAVSFAETCRALSVGDGRCYVTGTPIRELDDVDPVAARERFGVPPNRRLVLVFGGSQAVRRFNAAVAGALPRLVERVHVIHVTGDAGYADALAGREALPEAVRDRYRPYAFLGEEMASALVAADLIVGRAGSSTLAEATALGKPVVVVPYPHAAGHQRANARRLVESGAGRLVDDDAFDAEALLAAATILADPALHARMSAASRELGRPGAADAVARLVLAAGARATLPAAAEIDRSSRTRSPR